LKQKESEKGLPLKMETSEKPVFHHRLKRAFDLACSGLGLLALWPVGLFIGLLIKLTDGGPIFYGQTRIGQFGNPFRIWKFRSMVIDADKLGVPLTKEEDPRITWVGRFLRKGKLDELPQLWNVLIGDMSFVGPRPEVPRYVDRYTSEQRQILKFKPGITDVATMLFRNEEALLRGTGDVEGFYLQYCLPKKIELNLQYAQRANLIRDIWIIVQTLCPYWLGVLIIYAIALTGSFGLAYELRSDFHANRQDYDEFRRYLPWIMFPQLVLLFWGGQLRGLISYFSIPELRRTAGSLGIAFLIQYGLCKFSQGRLAPTRSLLLIDLFLSFFALCAVRMAFRFLREHSSQTKPVNQATLWRVAIIGTGELATNLALDFARSKKSSRRVVAFFDDNPRTWHKRPHDIPVIGMPECLLNPEWRSKIDEVIVALPEENLKRTGEIRQMLKNWPVNVTDASGWPELKPLEIQPLKQTSSL
jgi:lipopolysaccharide/colanic/teichoic acid biosynthesis glycosyltransferase